MSIQTVGVVGAGVMGRGVSHALAESGHKVILLDLSEEILGSARNEIRSNVRMYSVFSKEKATTADAVLDNITFSTDYELLSDVDYLVENARKRKRRAQ